MTNLYIFIAVGLVSLMGFVGILGLVLKEEKLKQLIPYLIALSTGTMLGGFFLHILPELVESSQKNNIEFNTISWWLLFGIFFFFAMEKIFHWHHFKNIEKNNHCEECQKHQIKPVGYMILFSDGVHNFLDGVAVASAFSINIETGVITTILVLLHELPHEFGNFGVLLNAGFKTWKALWFNFLSALTSVLGAIATIISVKYIEGIGIYLTAIAGGSFIYISLVNLIPELHNHKHEKKYLLFKEIFVVLLGIFFMWLIKYLEGNFGLE